MTPSNRAGKLNASRPGDAAQGTRGAPRNRPRCTFPIRCARPQEAPAHSKEPVPLSLGMLASSPSHRIAVHWQPGAVVKVGFTARRAGWESGAHGRRLCGMESPEDRDRQANERDRAAGARDIAAGIRHRIVGRETPGAHGDDMREAAVDRMDALADREAARRDRESAARERDGAADDRGSSLGEEHQAGPDPTQPRDAER